MNDCCKIARVRILRASGPRCLACAKTEPRLTGGTVYKAPERKEEASLVDPFTKYHLPRSEAAPKPYRASNPRKPRPVKPKKARHIYNPWPQGSDKRPLNKVEAQRLLNFGSLLAVHRASGVPYERLCDAIKPKKNGYIAGFSAAEVKALSALTLESVGAYWDKYNCPRPCHCRYCEPRKQPATAAQAALREEES